MAFPHILASRVFGVDRARTAVLAVMCLLLAACGSTLVDSVSEPNGLAVVVVAVAKDIDVDRSDAAITLLLEDAISVTGRHDVTPLSQVVAAIGAERHAVVKDEFSRTGRIVNASLQQVMSTPLGARRGLLLRVDENRTDTLEPRFEPFRDTRGRVVPDRQTVVLSSLRQVRVTASVIDLVTGSVRWQRAWTASPQSRSEYVRYTGSSFGGSLSATLANSVVNGLRGPAAPPPPELDIALDAVFRELAESLPTR